MLVPPTCQNKEGKKYLSHMFCQCGGTGKGIKSKVGGELGISLQALFTYLCDLCAFECAISPLILLFFKRLWAHTCALHDQRFDCLCALREILRFCVCSRCKFSLLEGSWRRFWSLRRILKSLGKAFRFWRPFGVWKCTSPRLVLFGGISKHWMCNPAL